MKHLFELFGTVAIIAAVFYICFGLFSVLFAVTEILYSIYIAVFYYLNFCK